MPNKKGYVEWTTKHVIYWILIAISIFIMWFIVKGIINKLLTLY